MAVITFKVKGKLGDYGADVREGIKVCAVGDPKVKIDNEDWIRSNEPEFTFTDENGLFEFPTLVSIPGLWYRIYTPDELAMNPVRVAGYDPDPLNPKTGTAFAPGKVVDLAEIMDENPTPGYQAVFLSGGGGVTDHALLTGRSTADAHPMSAITGLVTELAGKATSAQGAKADTAVQPTTLAAHEADTTSVHGIADTGALVVTTDPRLADSRAPLPHTSASVTDFVEAAQDAIAALLAGASGVTLNYNDVANTLTITGPGASGLDAEAVRDAIGVALVGTGLLTVTVSDALDTITLSTTATANATDAALRDRSTHSGTQGAETITGLATVATTGAYSDLTGKPSTMTPTAHAATHATGQPDAVSPASIGAATSGHNHTGTYAPVLGIDDNYVTDAEKTKLSNLSGTNTGDQTLPTWGTIAGKPAVVAAGATQADARAAIGAGTGSSSFSGAYTDLTGKPTLGTAAATDTTAYATAAQGTLAASASQPGHAHVGGDITSGTVAYGRLPVGTTASTVAAGDDSRIAGAIQAAIVDAKGDLLAGTAADTVARVAVGSAGDSLTPDTAATPGVAWAVPLLKVASTASTSIAPVLADHGKYQRLTASTAVTITLPSDATQAFPVGSYLLFKATTAAGLATFTAGSGATLEDATPSAVMRAEGSLAQATKVASNTWTVDGDLA